MHLRPDEPQHVARLLGFLQHGEWLARDVAARQARLAAAPALRCFFATQSRQELFHAAVFQGAVHWLAPRGVKDIPGLPELERYRTLTEAAIARGDLAESVLALQVLFEALGDVAFEAIDTGIERRGGGFGRLRRVLRAQEQGHHAFGVRLLNQLAASADARRWLQQRAQDYLELVSGMLAGLDGLFVHFDEDPRDYLAGFRRRLPAWLLSA